MRGTGCFIDSVAEECQDCPISSVGLRLKASENGKVGG